MTQPPLRARTPPDAQGGAAGVHLAPGELILSNTPALSSHRGTQPDLCLRWNDLGDGASAIDVVVHLHGYADRGQLMQLALAVERSGLEFYGPGTAAGVARDRPTIGIIPRGNAVGGRVYDFPALKATNGLATLIEYALRMLAGKFGVAGLRRGRLIVTSHSGSGADVEALVAVSSLRPEEIHLFDATYWPAPNIAKWAKRRIGEDQARLADLAPDAAPQAMRNAGGALRVLAGPYTSAYADELARAMAPALATGGHADVLKMYYRVDRTAVDHLKVPAVFGYRLLADAATAVADPPPDAPWTTLGPGSRGEDVSAWQAFLIGQSLRTRSPDASFDQETNDETIIFQRAHALEPDGKVGRATFAVARTLGFDPPGGRGELHVETLAGRAPVEIASTSWGEVMPASTDMASAMSLTPAQRLVCERIINVYETGSITGDYANITIYPDGPHGMRQITYGRAQTTEYGNLAELVRMYVEAAGTYATQLRPFVPLIGNTALVDNETFKQLLRRAGRDDNVMMRTQDAFFDKRYFQSALKWANANRFRQALSMLVIYDSFIHSGGILGFLRSRFQEKPPAFGGDEREWIRQYVDVRHEWLANHDNPLLRQTIYRTRDFKREIGRGNWDLAQLPYMANGTRVTADGANGLSPGAPPQAGVVPFLGDADFADATGARVNEILAHIPMANAGAPAPVANRGNVEESFSVDTLEGIRAIQEVLSRCGYLDPPADGAFGPVSKWALWEFAKRAGLSSADLTADLRRALATAQDLPLLPSNDLAGAIAKAMQKDGYWLTRHPDCLNIIYVEGMDPDGSINDNRNNVFNDLRILLRVNENGVPVIVGKWDGTTEPSRRWTLEPMNPGGAFHIKFGQYKAWIKGYYHNQEALIQAGEIQGYRDPHKTFKRDYNFPVSGSDFGVFHHGGYDLPHNDMGNSSAGCLVGRTMQGHTTFMEMLKSDARYRANPTYRFMAAILPATDVVPLVA